MILGGDDPAVVLYSRSELQCQCLSTLPGTLSVEIGTYREVSTGSTVLEIRELYTIMEIFAHMAVGNIRMQRVQLGNRLNGCHLQA